MDPQYRKFMCDQPPTKIVDDKDLSKMKPKSPKRTSEKEGSNFHLSLCNVYLPLS